MSKGREENRVPSDQVGVRVKLGLGLGLGLGLRLGLGLVATVKEKCMIYYVFNCNPCHPLKIQFAAYVQMQGRKQSARGPPW